ncbi:MAG TPA: acetyl-CoA carboxylase carboxyltransferase subunit beta [Candidatus Latescibacteria bacterium]|nr:acetyl-CoA carboxylase carboxyltransferase subunit beta [Candidatus Latescibacterota bacterium]
MNWFERMKKGIRTLTKRELPEDLWAKCEGCGEILYKKELERSLWVCSKCGYHFRIGHKEYVNILLDEGSFEEMDVDLTSADPLKFRDSKRYTDRVREARRKTGVNSALRTGIGRIEGCPVAFGVMDFGFIGGSMGSAVGEKFKRLVDRAIADGRPLVVVAASGGARMQEGALSLMQMVKTSAKLTELSGACLPYISVLTHPTTGGVTASFAMLGDVLIAEPGALIGFAGPRVIQQALGLEKLPEGFQRAESLLEHGFLDMVVDRRELKGALACVLAHLTQSSLGEYMSK